MVPQQVRPAASSELGFPERQTTSFPRVTQGLWLHEPKEELNQVFLSKHRWSGSEKIKPECPLELSLPRLHHCADSFPVSKVTSLYKILACPQEKFKLLRVVSLCPSLFSRLISHSSPDPHWAVYPRFSILATHWVTYRAFLPPQTILKFRLYLHRFEGWTPGICIF